MQNLLDRMEKARFSISTPHECGYLPGNLAVTLMADPKLPWSGLVYQYFLDFGFRRSGNMVYRPYCPLCRNCIPVRIPAAKFHYSRAMRRCWRYNQDLQVAMVPAKCNQERFDLYCRYITSRHGDGPMANPTEEGFVEFLLFPKIDVVFYEFRRQERLVAVAVCDILPNSLSAVYTFFDPEEQRASLGTYAVLWQVTEALRLRKDHLYLGYYIEHCQKMSYKIRFRPLEAMWETGWSTTIPHYESDSYLEELYEREGITPRAY